MSVDVFFKWCERRSASELTNLMPQHAFQPLLSGRANIDGEFGFVVDHHQRGSGQQVIGQPHQDLTMQKHTSPASVFQQNHIFCQRSVFHVSQESTENRTLQSQEELWM